MRAVTAGGASSAPAQALTTACAKTHPLPGRPRPRPRLKSVLMLRAAALLLPLALFPSPARAQHKELSTKDYSIYGKVMQRDINPLFPDITRKCFFGFGFIACESVGAPPNLVNAPYHWRTAVKDGSQFCLQCCDNTRQTRTFSETWNLKCDIAQGGINDKLTLLTNPYQWEFRFARRENLGDQGIVSCPIVRPPEVWVVTVRDTVAPVGGYFRLLLGGRAGTFSANINHDAVAMAWQELRLCAGGECPGYGLGESMQSKLHAPLKTEHEDNGHPIFFPVEVSRSSAIYDNGSRVPAGYGYSWSITFPTNEFPSIVDDEERNYYVQSEGRFAANTTSIVVSQLPPTQMHGYKLDIEVRERFDGINYWRNVRGCNVTTVERLGAPTAFYESYHLFSTESAAAAMRRPSHVVQAFAVLAAAIVARQARAQ